MPTYLLNPGNWIVEDDGIPNNNRSQIRNLDTGTIQSFVHAADFMTFLASGPGVHLTVAMTDSIGGALFTVGDLTDPSVTPDSLVIAGIVGTSGVTLVSNGSISEGADIDAEADVIAGHLALSAVTGIGSAANPIETQIGVLEAETDSGGIYLANTGAMAIGGITDQVAGVRVFDTGNVSLTNLGSIFVTEADPGSSAKVVRAGDNGGNVTLVASGAEADITATEDVDPVYADFGNVVLSAGRDIHFGAGGLTQSITASGSITATAGRDVILEQSVLYGASGGVSVSAGRNATITDGGGLATFADILLAAGPGGTLTMTGGFGLSAPNGDIVLRGDRMVLATSSNPINATQGTVTIVPASPGRRIDLGSATDTGLGIELSDAELDSIIANGGLVIGDEQAGRLSVSSAISLLFESAQPANVTLRTGRDAIFGADFETTGTLTVLALDDIKQSGNTITATSVTLTVDAVEDDPGVGGTTIFPGSIVAPTITIYGGSDNDSLTGPQESARLFGFDGDDYIRALFGNDVVDGGPGNDHMEGFDGDDTFYVDAFSDVVIESAGEGTDRVQALNSYTLGASMAIEILESTNISGTAAQNLSGNELAQTITGNNGVNILEGFDGNDTLNGNGGDDYLSGGLGDDTMDGGAGNDVYFVDSTLDQVNEVAGFGTDRIATSISFTLNGGTSIETLETVSLSDTTAINLTGNALGQTIIGNDGVNVLAGGGGSDVLIAAGGDDFLVGNALAATQMQGGSGNDTFYVYHIGDAIGEVAGAGTDRVAATVSYTLTAGAHVELLEAADLAGTAAISLAGNELAQTVTGNAGNNRLNGRGGNDVLQGLGGNDTLIFNTALGAGNVDQILGFATAADRIELENAVFTGLAAGALPASAFKIGAAANEADDRIVYNSTTGALLFDADGDGAGAAVQFATLTGAPTLAASDFVVV